MKDLYLDFSPGVAGLPDMPNIKINAGANGNCRGLTDGWYSPDHTDPEQPEEFRYFGDWESPLTAIKTIPAFEVIADPTFSFTYDHYATRDPFIYSDYDNPSLNGCYNYAVSHLYILETGPTGSCYINQGDEPDRYAYFVKVRSFVYTDTEGDCILRIGFQFHTDEETISIVDEVGYTQSHTGYTLFPSFGDRLINGTTAEHKYSDQHPCFEDGLGSEDLDSSWDNEFLWLSGFRFTAAEFAVFSGAAPADSEDLTKVGFFSPFPFGPSTVKTWVWEINLTDEGITDLASFTDIGLDASNMTGIVDEAYGFYSTNPLAIVAKPAGFDDTEYFLHEPDSVALASSNISLDAANSDIKNSPGQHTCTPGPLPPFCEQGESAALNFDLIRWKAEFDVVSEYIIAQFGNFSFTLKSGVS